MFPFSFWLFLPVFLGLDCGFDCTAPDDCFNFNFFEL